MKHSFTWLVGSWLLAVGIAGCGKKEANEVAPTSSHARTLSVSPVLDASAGSNVMGPVVGQGIRAVDAVSGNGRIVYIMSVDSEPSGGYQLYWYQDTGVSTAFNYIPSPGALAVAELDNPAGNRKSLMIIDVNYNILYENGSGWAMLNSGGLKFNRIATRDFYLGYQSTNGLLYGITRDNHVYKFNTATLAWNLMGPQLATEITIDPGGHPWIIGPNHTSAGNIYRAAGYGQTFGGWVPYAGYGTKITATGVFSDLGIAIAGPEPDPTWGNNPPNPLPPSTCVLWSPLPTTNPPVSDFRLAYTFPVGKMGETPNVTGITGLKIDKLWIAAALPSYSGVLYYADFSGI